MNRLLALLLLLTALEAIFPEPLDHGQVIKLNAIACPPRLIFRMPVFVMPLAGDSSDCHKL